ncbi:hypothetical protein BDU57DRAFT_520076 [Ampelomyces quisqualis]|uniref:Uncharacterized protein n=1 Tax=Ampelomyces quisqualis TaxID=50730 RepID=A0A6A5QJ81_AMPQU|nr:hypothetical protein BDU57DRAFT_520076 [Ampelomyces quisqualis]
MSTFDEQQYHTYHRHSLFVDPQVFTYVQYGTEREKTPESIVNHSGYSPTPLTATPPLSRNPSRPPEAPRDQPPEHMLYDNGSLSNSPTSVKTPNDESFEVEMLDTDIRNFYQGVSMSTQASHNVVPAMDQTMLLSDGTFSDYTLHTTLGQVMASHAQPYNPPYMGQDQHMNHYLTTQPQDNAFYPNYTTESLQHDPWNGHGPSRSSITPRTGGVIFDAVTDPAQYGEYLPNSVQSWAMNFTDPHDLVSPSERPLSQETFFNMALQNMAPQNMDSHDLVYRPQISIPQSHTHNANPADVHWNRASPPPDQHNFVNYDANSTLFTESYITDRRHPRPASPGNSSVSQYPPSPYQPIISPSAVSPGSSDGVFSYQSDSVMMLDPVPLQHFDQMQQMPSVAVQAKYNLVETEPVQKFEVISAPESAEALKNLGKNGGRALGTHLEPNVAKAAHDMRKIHACWHCVLQRDKCGPGDVCERCLKRAQRPNADCGLGCNRIKLVELSPYFLPGLVTQMHEDSHLKHFVNQYVHGWGNTEFTLYMTCGGKTMPRIAVKVYEFTPKGHELTTQIQYVTDPRTNKRIAVTKQSPALGMVHINHNEEKTYDKYISDIVDHHLDDFGDLCWKEDNNDFLPKLFKLMARVTPKNEDEGKLLREVYRLIVVTFIMSHTLTIAEESKHLVLCRMHSYGGPNAYTDTFTSPRMTNRQLKYFFSRLQRSISATVLNKLQQIFKSSKGCDKWLAAFIAVIGMCMALEDQQKTIHLVMATRSATEGTDPRDAQGQADVACREIDNRVQFVMQIFRWKYNRKHNPIADESRDWEKESGFGGRGDVDFVRKVSTLVKENTDYLRQQTRVSISHANQTHYSARLVGDFLLSFWLPNAS